MDEAVFYAGALMFAFGVLVGLLISPSTEKVNAAHVDGWLAGYSFAKSEKNNG